MKRSLSLLFLVTCMVALSMTGCTPRSDLRIVTEENRPLNYTVDGETDGMTVELVRMLQEKVGNNSPIEVMDWEKGLELAKSEPNVALFTTTLTEERKELFQWVGPVAMPQYVLFSRADSDLDIQRLPAAREVDGIAVPRAYAVSEILGDAGFENLVEADNSLEALKMLLNGEVELFAGNTLTLESLLKEADTNRSAIMEQITVNTELMYIAFSRQTPAETIAAWQNALDDAKRDGSFGAIYRKWFPLEPVPQMLQLVTEDYPPLTFMEDDEVTGLGTAIVREICDRTGTPDKIRMMAWDSAYNLALLHPNVVLFTIKHTVDRDPLFHWIGPLGSNKTMFYTRKGSRLSIDSMADAKKVDAIATTTGWFSEQELQRAGFKNLVSSPYPEQNVKQLMRGEVQLGVFTDLTIPEIARKAGYSIDDFKPVYSISEGYFYIAVSRGTPQSVIDEWTTAYENMKKDGTLAMIYQQWLPDREPPQ